MTLKKQQLLALAVAICCAAAVPLQAEAKKQDNKTAKQQTVVAAVPLTRNHKQALVQAVPAATGRSAASVKALAQNKKLPKSDLPLSKKNNKTDSSITVKGAVPKTAAAVVLPEGYQEIGIFGDAVATKGQAVALLKQTNPDLRVNCSTEELVELYWQEAGREGVRQDLAFAQALVETGHFRFGGDVKPEQNNFCGLGTTGGGVKGAHFETPEIGVRAHIQHLLAYTAQKHPSTQVVDPRYDMAHAIRLERGLCDTWYKLNGTWAMSPNYSEKIMVVWQRMLAMTAADAQIEHEKKDDKVKKEEATAAKQHKMRDLVDQLLKKNK